MLFTLEPLMPDLFIYDNVRCSLLVPRILHIKMLQAAESVFLVKWEIVSTLTLVLWFHMT